MTTDGWTYADVWEAVAARFPDARALVHGDRTITWQELDRRANGVAHALLEAGLGRQAKVAQYQRNSPAYLEVLSACFKASLVPVNTNYRYVDDELRYLWTDSDSEAVVFDAEFTETVDRLRGELADVKAWIRVGDDASCPDWAIPYERAAASHPERVEGPWGRSGDDLYLLYTGGTTGYPKGVMWRQEDIFHVALEQRRRGTPRATSAAVVAERAARTTPQRMLVLGPVMHAAGQWNALSMLLSGSTVVLNTDRVFSPTRTVELAHREKVTIVQCVGDAMARPLAHELLRSPGRCPSLTTLSSGGTPLTTTARQLWRAWKPTIAIRDNYGGSETGVCGSASDRLSGKTRRFTMGASVAVLDDQLRPLPPGSDQIGRIARTGRIPLGYYNDPEKTAQTFPVDASGRRWALSGDYGTIAADGTIELLGRGATVINTGGEKVYPEEVEAVLKTHPDVADAIVVAAPDERLGQRVSAVISLAGNRQPSDAELRDHCREHLAGFKIPRTIRIVDEVKRTAAGKQDYRWASRIARDAGPVLSR